MKERIRRILKKYVPKSDYEMMIISGHRAVEELRSHLGSGKMIILIERGEELGKAKNIIETEE